MTISEKQLREATKGAFTIENNAGEYTFHRFAKFQEDYYLETSPRDFYLKTAATSGVRLDFRTDSGKSVFRGSWR